MVSRIIETGRLEFDEPGAAGVTVLQAIEGFQAAQTSRGPLRRIFGSEGANIALRDEGQS